MIVLLEQSQGRNINPVITKERKKETSMDEGHRNGKERITAVLAVNGRVELVKKKVIFK